MLENYSGDLFLKYENKLKKKKEDKNRMKTSKIQDNKINKNNFYF